MTSEQLQFLRNQVSGLISRFPMMGGNFIGNLLYRDNISIVRELTLDFAKQLAAAAAAAVAELVVVTDVEPTLAVPATNGTKAAVAIAEAEPTPAAVGFF